MKKIEMLFYQTAPSEKNTGLKYVLWEVKSPEGTAYDWGFAMWDGKQWEEMTVPDGWSATVLWWSNTVNPTILLAEQGRIVGLNGKRLPK